MEPSQAAPLPKGRPEGSPVGGGGGNDVAGRFVVPGVASGSKMEGEGASLVLLPLFTGRVFDPLVVS